MVKDLVNVGNTGEIKAVPVGFWRNYLLPNGFAKLATEGILSQIRKQKEDVIRSKLEQKAQAKAFATALQTIGKFMIKKKTGDKDQIYGRCVARGTPLRAEASTAGRPAALHAGAHRGHAPQRSTMRRPGLLPLLDRRAALLSTGRF